MCQREDDGVISEQEVSPSQNQNTTIGSELGAARILDRSPVDSTSSQMPCVKRNIDVMMCMFPLQCIRRVVLVF